MKTILGKTMQLSGILLVCILFSTCQKTFIIDLTPNNNNNDPGGYQDCFKGFHLTVGDSVIYAGDDVTISSSVPDVIYQWSGPTTGISSSIGSSVIIEQIKTTQSGWYHCTVSGPQCNPVTDSIYINVRYPQDVPSCTVTDNAISNTAGVPNLSDYSVTKNFDASTNGIAVEAYYSIGAPVYYFYFNSNNGNTEPKDGVYKTKNIYVFDGDDDANTVNVACNYFPFYFNSHNDQKVYLTHVNGKIRITFCSLNMSDGDNGGAQGLFTGQVTEK